MNTFAAASADFLAGCKTKTWWQFILRIFSFLAESPKRFANDFFKIYFFVTCRGNVEPLKNAESFLRTFLLFKFTYLFKKESGNWSNFLKIRHQSHLTHFQSLLMFENKVKRRMQCLPWLVLLLTFQMAANKKIMATILVCAFSEWCLSIQKHDS